MASGSLLNNRQFNKLLVNRLQANEVKAKEIDSKEIDSNKDDELSLLFSLTIPEATWINGNNNMATLKFNTSDIDLITFSDRPKRVVYPEETGKNAEQHLNKLFNLDKTNNSLGVIPPNATLVKFDKEKNKQFQIAIEILSLHPEGKLITVVCKILQLTNGIIPKLESFNKSPVSLFIDSYNENDTHLTYPRPETTIDELNNMIEDTNNNWSKLGPLLSRFLISVYKTARYIKKESRPIPRETSDYNNIISHLDRVIINNKSMDSYTDYQFEQALYDFLEKYIDNYWVANKKTWAGRHIFNPNAVRDASIIIDYLNIKLNNIRNYLNNFSKKHHLGINYNVTNNNTYELNIAHINQMAMDE